MAKKKDKDWVEQAVIVKKTHPWVKTKAQAIRLSQYHTKNGFRMADETPRSFRVTQKPSRCFMKFRAQKRGDDVTVIWGKLKKGAARKKSCR